jgi:hypothetical protein
MSEPEFDTLEALMQEPPGGYNHGRAASSDPEAEGRYVPLGVREQQAAAFMREGRGFTVVLEGDEHDAGMTAHRGVLQPGEYVDFFALRSKVEAALGYTYAQISAAYATGRPQADQRQLRDKIDARLLALSVAGGNMTVLAKVLGMGHATMERALARAKEAV